MNVTALNKATGEYIEMPVNSPAEIVQAYNIAREYDKAATNLKEQIKKLIPGIVNDKGLSEEINGYMFRISNVQRMTYDKAIMRQVLDEDTYDQFLKPDKPALDKFLKENLERLGDKSTKLRDSMVEDGGNYQVIKLEKVVRDE